METRINPIDGAELVYVPAGQFRMGMSLEQIKSFCSKTGTDPSNMEMMRPQRLIYLDAFWIYRMPVTIGQYRLFCAANPAFSVLSDAILRANMPPLNMDDSYPISYVRWTEAMAFCKWAKCQLPSEAQWERAARGSDDRLYPWGNDWDAALANFRNKSREYPIPVDCLLEGESPCGAIQMAGNVSEWCFDRFAPYGYTKSPFKNPIEKWLFQYREDTSDSCSTILRNPTGPKLGQVRVIRGGGWGNANGHWAGLTTYRNGEDQNSYRQDLGFRPVIPA